MSAMTPTPQQTHTNMTKNSTVMFDHLLSASGGSVVGGWGGLEEVSFESTPLELPWWAPDSPVSPSPGDDFCAALSVIDAAVATAASADTRS